MGLLSRIVKGQWIPKREEQIVVEKTRSKVSREKVFKPWDSIPENTNFNTSFKELPPDWKETDYLKNCNSWVYSAVSAISDEVASIKLHLYEITGGDKKEIFDHPLLNLLHQVNSFTTKFDHWWLTQEYLELTGEAPWALGRDTKTGFPTSIYLLRPDKLTINFDNDKIIGSYTYEPNSGNKQTFKTEDIVLIKYPNPLKPLRGQGTLQAVAQTVDLDNYAEKWNLVFFYNEARPDAVVSTKDSLSDEQIKRLELAWNKKFKGIDKRAKIAFLEGGLEYKPIQISQKDMEFLEQQRFSRDKILSIFRVPKTVVAITEDVNLANAQVGAYSFARWTIKPKMTRIIEQLNEFLVPMFGDNLYLGFEDPVPENMDQKIVKYTAALGSSGWMTVNEIRALENLEPVEGGDVIYRGNSTLGSGNQNTQEPVIPPKGASFKMIKILKAKKNKIPCYESIRIAPRIANKQNVQDINDTIKAVIKQHLIKTNNIKKEIIKKQIREIKDPENFWTKQIAIEEDYEKKFIGILNIIFKEQEQKVLGNFKTITDNITQKMIGLQKKDKGYFYNEMKLNIPYFLLDSKDENKKMSNKTSPIIKATIIGIGKYVLDEMNSDNDFIVTDHIIDYLKKYPIKFAQSVNETTNQAIRDALAEGIKLGESTDKLRNRINKVFDSATKERAQMIVRTEESRATNFATEESYIQSGVVESKEWFTAMDERACEICNGMQGKIVPLEKEFFVDGYGNGNPPLHQNCRCGILPKLKK